MLVHAILLPGMTCPVEVQGVVFLFLARLWMHLKEPALALMVGYSYWVPILQLAHMLSPSFLPTSTDTKCPPQEVVLGAVDAVAAEVPGCVLMTCVEKILLLLFFPLDVHIALLFWVHEPHLMNSPMCSHFKKGKSIFINPSDEKDRDTLSFL